jgi:hypothetical protein
MAVGQDQLVFVTAVGAHRFVRSVPAGQGDAFLQQLLETGGVWIQVDESTWIQREHVLYVQLLRADQAPFLSGV